MTTRIPEPDSLQSAPDRSIRLLELAVPLLSFAGAVAAFLVSGLENPIDIRYCAAGCIAGSFILAYLAWIRPRKDIVALTTPIYSVFFFVMPSDISVGSILILLYAASLTILLVRLNLRFGPVGSGSLAGDITLAKPMQEYCATVQQNLPAMDPEMGHRAALVFTWFSRGDYPDAAREAEAVLTDRGMEDAMSPVNMSMAIVRDHALYHDGELTDPGTAVDFPLKDATLLAKTPGPESSSQERSEIALDNALLLLFAAAWNMSEKDRSLLLKGQGFALKLLAP